MSTKEPVTNAFVTFSTNGMLSTTGTPGSEEIDAAF
jgi:hypothetical protein